MNEHKEFTLQVKRVAGIKVAGCADCGGSRLYYSVHGTHHHEWEGDKDEITLHPCPTCAPLRELEKLCWHEAERLVNYAHFNYHDCIYCGKMFHKLTDNPTYTIQSIRAMLTSLGEWEGFVSWHDYQACGRIRYVYRNSIDGSSYTADYEGEGSIVSVQTNADILTSDTLMLKAAIEYLKEVK